jgi:hypothetical protein
MGAPARAVVPPPPPPPPCIRALVLGRQHTSLDFFLGRSSTPRERAWVLENCHLVVMKDGDQRSLCKRGFMKAPPSVGSELLPAVDSATCGVFYSSACDAARPGVGAVKLCVVDFDRRPAGLKHVLCLVADLQRGRDSGRL